MGCSLNFLRNPQTWVFAFVVPIPLLVLAFYWVFGFFSIFLTTSAMAVLSTFLISSSKNKPQEALKCCSDQSSDCFDGSVSDDESLFEIALPTGHYVGDQRKFVNLQARELPDFMELESMFKKQSLVELLADINEVCEEDSNMIEIDLSMGSIKCSRFEIEA